MTKQFEEIKSAFQDNCGECKLIDQKIAVIIEFKKEEDAEWFENNIVYPEGTMEKSPLKHVMKVSLSLKNSLSPFMDVRTHLKLKIRMS